MFEIRRFVLFWLWLLFGWWWLTEGEHQAWWFGVPVTLLVAGFTLRLWPSFRVRWSVLPGLVGFFVMQSWLGSWDVAKRAFRLNINVTPCFIVYELRLAPGLARDIWMATIGLFPGTMAVALDANQIKVHVLDGDMLVLPGLVKLEDYLLRLLP
jgi:multicomponent Na+:H+ antiporter subunit E